MKTKLFLIVSLISFGLISIAFQTQNELTAESSFKDASVSNHHFEIAKLVLPGPSDIKDQIEITNYPDPFVDVTSIAYSLQKTSFVRLVVHELSSGKFTLLYEGVQTKGTHFVQFDASSQQPGQYIAELSTDYFIAKEEMMLLPGRDGSSIRK